MVGGDIILNGVRVVKKVTADEDVGLDVRHALCVDGRVFHRISCVGETTVIRLG